MSYSYWAINNWCYDWDQVHDLLEVDEAPTEARVLEADKLKVEHIQLHEYGRDV